MQLPCRSLLLAVALLGSPAALFSCQKAADPAPETIVPVALLGRWGQPRSSGGIGGGTQPTDPQQRQELHFDAQQGQFFTNGAPVLTTTYSIRPALAATTQRSENFLTFGTATPLNKVYVSALTDSTLVLREDFADGHTITYQRMYTAWGGTR